MMILLKFPPCLKRGNLISKFKDLLVIKPLNFFIEDNELRHIKITDDILNVLVESYYNQIKINKDELLVDWEKWCSIDNYEKLKNSIYAFAFTFSTLGLA